MEWRLIKSGSLDPLSIHTIYEAIARSVSEGRSPNTLHICWPKEPYVCVGIHQVVELEVDINQCKKQNLPIIRRQIGGGAVYLDPDQFFYHIIINKKDAPLDLRKLFSTFLRPTICTYRKFGLDAKYKPINDVVINGKKVSGNGAATFDDAIVIVGNVILDFNPNVFASILRVPDEKIRDKLVKSMEAWVSSLRKELDYKPQMKTVENYYMQCFKKIFNAKFIESSLNPYEMKIMSDLKRRYSEDTWTYKYRYKHSKLLERLSGPQRVIKIMEGHYVVHVVEKMDKLIRVLAEIKNNKILDIFISGDFFLQPLEVADYIEKCLKNMSLDEIKNMKVENLLRDFEIKDIPPMTKRFMEQILVAVSKIENYLPKRH